MKHLILALFLAVATPGLALAEGSQTKAQNEAAMLAGHQVLASKAAQFEASLKANDSQTSAILAADIQGLMRKGMMQYMRQVSLEQGTTQKDAENHYRQMEAVNHAYNQLSTDVPHNGNQLLTKAKAFLALY